MLVDLHVVILYDISGLPRRNETREYSLPARPKNPYHRELIARKFEDYLSISNYSNE